MSFQSKSPRVLSQQLKVQELLLKQTEDQNLYEVDGGDLILFIDEPVFNVKCILLVDNSASETLCVPDASISIVDSSAFTAGGDKKAIKLSTFTFAANDSLILKYIIDEN